MKRLLLLVVICAMCSFAFSQNGRIPLNPSATKSGSLQSNSMSGFSTTFSFNSIESQSISNEKGNFSEISIDGSFPYGEVGSPSLPMVTRLIAIPEGATPTVTVNGYSESEYALADYDIQTLSAQQAPIRKDIDPTTVEYVVNNAAYARDTYTTDEIASVEYLGTMRGIRIGKLTIRPVAYNAAANTIKVCNDINVSVSFENANAALTQSMFASTYSPAFNSIYDQLLNKNIFGQRATRDAYSDHPDLYNTPVRMLVICYSGFRGNAALNQWLQWKLQKGYYVDIFYTDETGTTASAIASFIKTKYNASVSAGNAYTYLIVIGDTGQVPQYMNKNIDSDIGNCASDLGYSSVNFSSNTSNYFPDMFYSRISVENETHLTNYISKVLTYEKYEFTDGGNYLNNVILVGGWDSNWTPKVAKPTINYGKNNYFNSSNTTYGGFENGTINATISTSSTQGYAGTNNGCYNGINNGACFLNYTAHGDKQEWYQPQLTAAHAATLSNNGKYFFGVGNCCLTGNFNNTTTTYSPGSAIGTNACFAETMIRVPNAGAVAYVGCSPYSYWYEDFYWAVGAHSYSQGNAPSTSASTMGVYDAMFVDEYWNSASSLLYLGNLAVQQAVTNNNTNSSVTSGNCNNSAHYYFQFYHTFGDGSVMPYVTKPEVNNVTIPSSVMAGATSMTVNAVAGSYVAVTDNESTIYGVAVANASGVANVSLSNIPSAGTLYVVVTRQQYQPYFGTVSVITPNPPVADFTGTPTTILERESVTFTNNSQYAATCLWNFGDGETSTEMNPVHTYMTPGTYTVTLRVENNLGNNTKTRTNYITVNPNTNPPIADFVASVTEINMGGSVTFTDLTANIPTSWSWTFDGGTPATSTEQNPMVTYSESGLYTVTLVATNAYGSDTETKTAYINVLYPDIVMSNEDVYACGGTYKDPGGNSNYDNNLSYTQTIYPATSGAYIRLTFSEFSLEAAGSSGCYDELYIYDGTSASAPVLVNGVCGTSNPGTVTATNTDGALTIVFTSDYSQVSSGWLAEISCYIQEPEAAFTATADECSYDVTLTNESSFATSYLWDFGDGTTSVEANPTHTYASNGTYTIALTATNSLGSSTITHEVEISAPEISSSTNANGCGSSTL
ncbi:MAG: PKD domain-containing protein, partial [Bacteroidales bacterium]|nr:PKD domain-containing protein [Bacteroidales bacterium]